MVTSEANIIELRKIAHYNDLETKEKNKKIQEEITCNKSDTNMAILLMKKSKTDRFLNQE